MPSKWHNLGRAWVEMVWPDTHYPNQDEEAVEVAEQAHRTLRPDGVTMLGDVADCNAFSSHAKKSLEESEQESFLESELDPIYELLMGFKRCGSYVTYIEGNHEHRVERWAVNGGAGCKAAFDLVAPKNYLKGAYDKWVPYQAEPLRSHHKIAPDLWAVHGWSHAKAAAQKHLEATSNFSIVHGHTHRRQEASRKDPATNRLLYAWSPGCLAKKQPLWTGCNPTNWAHGFSVIYVGESGSWTHYNIAIENGRCILPDGREVRA